MFLTDFRMRKYTGGIISRAGIFLTVTPAPARPVQIKAYHHIDVYYRHQ